MDVFCRNLKILYNLYKNLVITSRQMNTTTETSVAKLP